MRFLAKDQVRIPLSVQSQDQGKAKLKLSQMQKRDIGCGW